MSEEKKIRARRRYLLTSTIWLLSAAATALAQGDLYDDRGRPWRESSEIHQKRADWASTFQSPPGLADHVPVNPIAQIWQEFQDVDQGDLCPPYSNPLWEPLGPRLYKMGRDPSNNTGGLGRINCLAFDPQDQKVIYAGSAAGGLWKTTDGAKSWEWLAPFDPRLLSISGIAIDPQDPETIYALTGDGNASVSTVVPTLPSVGVLKSTDAGRTWSSTGLDWKDEYLYYGFELVIDPNDRTVLFAVTNDGLYRTADSGQTWEQVLEGQTRDFEFHPADSSIAYVATTESIYRSTDHGRSWEPSEFSPTWGTDKNESLRRIALATTPSQPDRVFAVVGELTGFVGLYRSDDAGESYELISNAPNILGYSYYGGDASSVSYYALTIAANPSDANEVWVGGVNVWRSTDGGYTWSIKGYYDNLEPFPYIHADIHGLYFRKALTDKDLGHCPSADERREYDIFSANDAGIYKTEDLGGSWCGLSEGLRITQVYRLCGAAGRDGVFYGAQDNGSNGLKTQTAYVVFRGDGTECLIDHENPEIVYVSQGGGLLVKCNESTGEVVSVTPPKGDDESGAWVTPFVMHPEDSKTIYACYHDLWRTEDGGLKWSNLSAGELGDGTCTQIGVSVPEPSVEVLWVAKPSSVFVSQDGGTWANVTQNLPVDNSITNLAVSSGSPEVAWVTFGGYGSPHKVFATMDGGGHWKDVSGCLPKVPVRAIVYDGSGDDERSHGVFVGTDLGVFFLAEVCLTEGCSWQYLKGLPPFIVSDLEIHGARIRAATFAQGVWETFVHPPVSKPSPGPGPR